MDFSSRLSDYEILAYVPPGYLALAGIDIVSDSEIVLRNDWNVSTGILSLLFAYIVGHFIASASARIFEKGIVGRWLRPPSYYLLAQRSPSRIIRMTAPGYTTPLPRSLRDPIVGTTDPHELTQTSCDELFWQAYSCAKRDEHGAPRLSTFLKQYGFCRNTAFVLTAFSLCAMIAALDEAMNRLSGLSTETIFALLGLIGAAFFMFQRYLKFYRLYSLEVFVTYHQICANSPDRPDTTRV